jgi:hypothetical protein
MRKKARKRTSAAPIVVKTGEGGQKSHEDKLLIVDISNERSFKKS